MTDYRELATFGSKNNYHVNETIVGLDGTWQRHSFGFKSMKFMVNNRSTTSALYLSYDGTTIGERISPGEAKTFDGRQFEYVWIRGTSGEPYEFTAW